MGFFDFLRVPDINQGVDEQKVIAGSILLDVREADEYRSAHIPGSRNIPLHSLEKIRSVTNNKDTPVYVYCYSGARSRQASAALRRMGYTNVKNIGGIAAWRGKVER